MSDVTHNKRRYDFDLVFCLVISALVLATFWPVAWFEFIHFDDPAYVTNNPMVQAGLTAEGIRWAFTGIHGASWHPLATLSHMLDCQLWGLNARGHHLTNVGLHLANVLLLFFFLRRLGVEFWPRALICTAWALHPLRVESVAWVTERKDLLSAFWGIAALYAYTHYALLKKTGAKTRLWYGIALIFLALGLLSKAMLVTWPFVMLLLDFWPLNRVRKERLGTVMADLKPLVREKLPFFLLVGLTSVLTYIAQQHTGAVTPLSVVSLGARLDNAAVAHCAYLHKTLWPENLAVFYPLQKSWPDSLVIAGWVILLVMMVAAISQWRARSYLLFGFAWYLGIMLPVSGLVQVGAQAFADRFTYLPAIGLLLAVILAAWELTAKWQVRPAVFAVLTVGLAGVLASVSSRALSRWQNTFTLFNYALEVTQNNVVAHEVLGSKYCELGLYSAARKHFEQALSIDPSTEAIKDLSLLVKLSGNEKEANDLLRFAIITMQKNLNLSPNNTRLLFLYASTLETAGRPATEIAAVYRRLLAVNPQASDALNNLAWLLATTADEALRNGAEAAKLAAQACELSGYRKTVFIGTYAATLAEAGRFQEAVAMADRAIDSARKNGEKQLEETNLKLRELYQAGKTVSAR